MLYKYPRTFHVPWSEGYTSDDKVLSNMDHFKDKMVVVTEKMDGENTTMGYNFIYARSVDSKDHPSRHWVKKYWSSIKHDIPNDFRICGENLYAKHSIGYEDLKTYFYTFSIWKDEKCLNIIDTLDYCYLLNLTHVPIIYKGIYNEETIKYYYEQYKKFKISRESEGYVIRLYDEFNFDDFRQSVAKYVRKNHVTTDEHWMHSAMISNQLKE